MGLALDRDRVRSSVVLERTCRSFPKLIESLATALAGGCPPPQRRTKGALPKLGHRMPPTTQRRNTAYLNRANHRDSRPGRGSWPCEPASESGLAIDLGGSLEQRFRPADIAGAICAPPQRSSAAEPKGLILAMNSPNYRKDLCRLTFELSGARTGV